MLTCLKGAAVGSVNLESPTAWNKVVFAVVCLERHLSIREGLSSRNFNASAHAAAQQAAAAAAPPPPPQARSANPPADNGLGPNQVNLTTVAQVQTEFAAFICENNGTQVSCGPGSFLLFGWSLTFVFCHLKGTQ
jgi:hypothetical protein